MSSLSTTIAKQLTEEYANQMVPRDNNFPRETRAPVNRSSFKLQEEQQIFGTGEFFARGEFLQEAQTTCVICHQKTAPNGDSVLIQCHGSMSGELAFSGNDNDRIDNFNKKAMDEYHKKVETQEKLKKLNPTAQHSAVEEPRLVKKPFRECKSNFHMSCIEEYNVGNFHFGYSALPECQGKFQCPLHCCHRCNMDDMKQSAYGSALVECAKCLRAFHPDTCYPAGARDQYVVTKIDGNDLYFEMMYCGCQESLVKPKKSKAAGKEVLRHTQQCYMDNCSSSGPLVECKTCIRCFHRNCAFFSIKVH